MKYGNSLICHLHGPKMSHVIFHILVALWAAECKGLTEALRKTFMLSFEEDYGTKTAHCVSCDYQSHESGLGNRSVSLCRSVYMRPSGSGMS